MSGVPKPRKPILQFLGGARTVTGSRFLLQTPRSKVLIDCGLFQGLKKLRLRNWEPFPVRPSTLDAVVLTHAHLDHCGYLPALWQQGFRGRVLATRGTRDLCEVVLMDSARIQEDDAAYANRAGYSKHEPALPLYTQEDVQHVLERFECVPYHAEQALAADVRVEFHHAGHILGSAVLSLTIDGVDASRMVFSGDLGRPAHPILRPPDPLPDANTLILESTYGDRRHADEEVEERFAQAIARTVGRGGVVIIPAFAVDRTELVLRLLGQLARAGRVPEVPVYVDSPMALAALEIYRRAIAEGWDEIRPELHGATDPFGVGELIEVQSVAESRELTSAKGAAIIVSASGMATGGRVLHHLAARLPDARNTVILVGYQADGTRGRHLLRGTRTLKMLGQYVPVRSEVIDLTAFSVHADRDELVRWAGSGARPPGLAFVVHGEPEASEALRDALEQELDLAAVVPHSLERVRLL